MMYGMSAFTHDDLIARSVVSQLRGNATQAAWAHDPARWANDVLGVHLWSKQRDVMNSVRLNKKTVVASCHGTGKALSLDQMLPTPNGWARMGDIRKGSKVLGSNGQPVRVVATTPVHRPDMWRVWLRGPAGDEAVVCSGEHIWPVFDFQAVSRIQVTCQRARIPVVWWAWTSQSTERNVRWMADHLAHGGRLLIPGESVVPDAVPVPDWLMDEIAERGVVDAQGRMALAWRAERMGPMPEELKDLRRRCQQEGVSSLAARRWVSAGTDMWELAFPGWGAAALAHSKIDVSGKLNIANDPGTGQALAANAAAVRDGCKDEGFEVVRIEALGEGDIAAKCIQVDAPDHLYLCGEQRIPTHNSMIASVLACWWVATKPVGEAMVVSTAPTYTQVSKILWEEIRKHHQTAKLRGHPLPGYVTQSDEWKTEDGRMLGLGRKPADGDRHGFHGFHRRYILAIGDEACGLPEEIWTGIEAITTTDRCRLLYIGNPDDRNTEFGKVYLRPELAQDWSRINISAYDTPNFTGEEVPELLNEVLVSKDWAESRKRDWGEKDARYVSKVLGQFPEQSVSSLISPALVAQGFEDVPEWPKGNILRLGVDVARFGNDSTVVFAAIGPTAKYIDSWSGTDTTSSAHRVLRIAEELKERYDCAWTEIRVDATGLGAGVVDTLNARSVLLEQTWFTVYEMHGAAAPPLEHGGSVHGYGNARAWWYDQLRSSLRNGSVKLVENQNLRDDLSIIYYNIRNGKLFLMSKEEMRAKFNKSPDFADALVYCVSPVPDQAIGSGVYSRTAQEVADDVDLEDMEAELGLSISPF